MALAVVFACNDATAPADDFELPEPDLSLDPDRLVTGELIASPCAFGLYGNRLDHLREKREYVLVDVFFGHSETDSQDRPTWRDIGLVTAHGGRVLHRFNVPAVRARLLLTRIPDMVEHGRVVILAVPDPSRYDIRVSVGFTRPPLDTDVELFESLGGHVVHRTDFTNWFFGVIPDRSIPVLRRQSEARHVDPETVFCLG